jgi:hypothetical protein
MFSVFCFPNEECEGVFYHEFPQLQPPPNLKKTLLVTRYSLLVNGSALRALTSFIGFGYRTPSEA